MFPVLNHDLPVKNFNSRKQKKAGKAEDMRNGKDEKEKEVLAGLAETAPSEKGNAFQPKN